MTRRIPRASARDYAGAIRRTITYRKMPTAHDYGRLKISRVEYFARMVANMTLFARRAEDATHGFSSSACQSRASRFLAPPMVDNTVTFTGRLSPIIERHFAAFDARSIYGHALIEHIDCYDKAFLNIGH